MAVVLAHWPLRGNSGPKLLWAVAGFGVFTIIFGLSRSLTLSLIALFLLGASDMISVIIRATLTHSGDSGRNAWTRHRRRHDFHWYIERVRTVRVWRHGAMVRDGTGRGAGRSWHSGGDRAVGLVFPELRQAGELHSIAANAQA